MGVVQWDVEQTATKRLRFDDPEFLEALALPEDTDETSLYAKVRSALGVSPSSADASGMAADGVYLDVRRNITGAEEDQLTNVSQQKDSRKGYKFDADAAHCWFLGTWVTGVGDDVDGIPQWLKDGSSRPTPKLRHEVWRKCPAPLRSLILARVRVWEHTAMAPVVRDPGKSTGKAGSNSHHTPANSDGVPASAPTASG